MYMFVMLPITTIVLKKRANRLLFFFVCSVLPEGLEDLELRIHPCDCVGSEGGYARSFHLAVGSSDIWLGLGSWKTSLRSSRQSQGHVENILIS